MRRNSTILFPVSPSREAVGSSKIRISGSATIARAMATRCCSPPLELDRGEVRSALETDDLEESERGMQGFRPGAASQDEWNRHVLCGREPRKEMVVLEYEAKRAKAEPGELIVAEAPDVPALYDDRATARPQDAGEDAKSVVFPLPEGPTM